MLQNAQKIGSNGKCKPATKKSLEPKISPLRKNEASNISKLQTIREKKIRNGFRNKKMYNRCQISLRGEKNYYVNKLSSMGG